MLVARRRQEGLTRILVALLAGWGGACQSSDDPGGFETDGDADSDGDADGDADADADADGDADADAVARCADGAMAQEIAPDLVGCGGAVLYADRESLCGAGSHVCSADEWVEGRGLAVPANHYWTNDATLGFAWSGDPATVDFTCWADDAGSPGVEPCEDGEPMHVCAPGERGDLPQGTEAVVDTFANDCNWFNCGLGVYPATEYFGGCSGNDTAGTLCCR